MELAAVPEGVTRRAIAAVERERNMGFKWKEMIPNWLVLKANGLAPLQGGRAVLGENRILVKKSFAGLQVEVVFVNLGADRASVEVKAFEATASEEPLRVTLQQDGREVSSYLSSAAEICFEDIPFGPYKLTFTRAGREVGEYAFDLKERRHGRK